MGTCGLLVNSVALLTWPGQRCLKRPEHTVLLSICHANSALQHNEYVIDAMPVPLVLRIRVSGAAIRVDQRVASVDHCVASWPAKRLEGIKMNAEADVSGACV